MIVKLAYIFQGIVRAARSQYVRNSKRPKKTTSETTPQHKPKREKHFPSKLIFVIGS